MVLTEKQKKEKKAEANRRYKERKEAGLVGKKEIKSKSIPKTNTNQPIAIKTFKCGECGKTIEYGKPHILKDCQKINFREVKNIECLETGENRLRYEITLEDDSTSLIDVLKDGEYVMQGDDRQRFSSSELKAIVDVLDKNNEGLK